MNLPYGVTPAQRRMWVMIAAGCHKPEMAAALGYKLRSLETQVRSLYWRIGARGIADVTRLAVRYGVIVMQSRVVLSEPLRTYYVRPAQGEERYTVTVRRAA